MIKQWIMELIVFASRKACEKLSGNYENRENVIVDFYNNVTNVMKKTGSSRNISIICSCKKLNYALIDIHQCLDIKRANNKILLLYEEDNKMYPSNFFICSQFSRMLFWNCCYCSWNFARIGEREKFARRKRVKFGKKETFAFYLQLWKS